MGVYEYTTQTSDFLSKPSACQAFQEFVSNSYSKEPSNFARVSLSERKSLDKDALQAVKLDPAVLEAQVTVNTRARPETPCQDQLAVVAKRKGKDASYPSFEEVLSMQQAALLGLSMQQLELLMAFVESLRRQRLYTQKYLECAFCKNNGEPAAWYGSHTLRDRRRVRCPVLRALRCPRCGATGDRAHTDKYCPLNVLAGRLGSFTCLNLLALRKVTSAEKKRRKKLSNSWSWL